MVGPLIRLQFPLKLLISAFLVSGMSNCRFFQCNLDYFCGDFDIGVSLHACGLATDLVLAKCLSADSSFVCCPCCYGAVRESRLVTYPKSAAFRKLGLGFKVREGAITDCACVMFGKYIYT